MKKIIKISIFVLIGFGMIYLFYFLYNKSKKEPIVFETQSAFVTNIIKKTVATGSIMPRREIEIKPQVSGIVEKIYIEPGMLIKKGDLIARVKIIPDMVSLNDAESRVNKAKINLTDAKTVYEREKQLYDQKVTPIAELEKYKVAYDNAKEAIDAAENHLQLIREGINKKSGEATNTLVRSTIDGMVLSVPIEEGNSVIQTNNFNAGTTIAFIADMGEMIFKGKVDEAEVGKLKQGMKLIVTIGAIENESFDAVLEYIAPKGILENGAIQFDLKAKMKLKKNSFIRSGYSANADIVLDQRDSVLAIPESLIIFEGAKTSVEIETKPAQFEKRTITTGLSDGINIEVLSGLKKTDKIKVPK